PARVQGLPSSAQVAPAFPAGCWQVLLVPSHWSKVQGFPSEVEAVPLAFLTSVAGQVALEPVQVSAMSHSPAASRQVFELLSNMQLDLQQGPESALSVATVAALAGSARVARKPKMRPTRRASELGLV